MPSYTYDYTLLAEGLRKGVTVECNDEGLITSIQTGASPVDAQPGILTPGFINAHCHTELSYLKGLIPRHTGMADFFSGIQSIRYNDTQQPKSSYILPALEAMYKEGVVGIADICNSTDSLEAKKQVPELRFHQFANIGQRVHCPAKVRFILIQKPKRKFW